MNAIITLKNISDFISKAFIIIGINLQDSLCNCLVFLCEVSRFSTVMLVIGAPVDAKYFTKKLDIVLETKLMNRI